MRTNTRSLSALASALLLAASAAAVSGCGKSETSPPPQSTPPTTFSQACAGPATTVTVFVENDGSTRNKEVLVCERRDSVEWVPADPETYVSDDLSWPNGSPFEHKPTHVTHGKRKILKSEPPKKGTAGYGFPYEAWLVTPTMKVKVDPRIVVMP